MKNRVLSLNILLMVPLVTQAQEHVHGTGSVFIVQEGANWQVQYVLSASDVLGFEHAPENQQQHDSLASRGNTLTKIENLMDFNRPCTQVAYSHNLSEFEPTDHHENEEVHDEEHEEPHQDIQVSYTLKCSSGVTGVAFNVFEKMYSLQRLSVQWSIDLGQGSAMISKDMTELEFNK